ncbi:RNA polymerase sigma factor [Spirillospora albida]|uniref:RNA polymerase sigma factor n=1 Tax=Spirillospora albida TaxID=58123 RepID=UPI0004C2281A|nr:sigma-70 family RNA polymerase sigma factor [Spirillospora albida]
MPSRTAPPLNEDFRLVEALRERRPGAVGQVYNVYAPELIRYAEELVGDPEAAVERVQAALVGVAERPEDVPDDGVFRDWLYERVRDEGRGPAPMRVRGRLVVAGIMAGAALTAGVLVLFDSTGEGPPPVAAPPPAVVSTSAPAPPAPQKRAPKPSPSAKPKKKATPRPAARGRLSLDGSACRGVRVAALPRTCSIRVTARGGPVRWSVASTSGRVEASGGGRLAAGRSASVTVTVRPAVLCFLPGGGNGAVAFAPGGSVSVTYVCWRG